jgi:exopolysaccharide biosynthesis polyprenyl glycosylphosphotransferase
MGVTSRQFGSSCALLRVCLPERFALSANRVNLRPVDAGSDYRAPLLGLKSLRPSSQANWRFRLVAAMIAADSAAIALSIAFAHLVRFGADDATVAVGGWHYDLLGVALGAAWLTALSSTRSRSARVLGAGITEYQRVVNATLMTFGALAVVALLADLNLARGYLAVAFPAGLVFLFLGRFLMRSWLIGRRRTGELLTDALVLGSEADARRVMKQLVSNPSVGYKASGVAFTHGGDGFTNLVEGEDVPVFRYDDLVTLVRSRGIRAVIVAGELPGGPKQIKELGWRLENYGVELILISHLTDIAGPRIHMRPINGLPIVHVDLPQYTGFNHVMKRVADIVLASSALAFFGIPMLMIAAVVKLDSRGPAFFHQERVGVQGTRFKMLKFRSMVADAEDRRASLLEQSDGNGVLFKLRADPRITRVGSFLRRYSLDELPQLINVLRGEMSIVGPRPPLADEVALYEEHATRRLLIKPGVTGLWQVSGRSNLNWDETVRLDLYYVENWSIVGDLIILGKTVRAVLRREGAY